MKGQEKQISFCLIVLLACLFVPAHAGAAAPAFSPADEQAAATALFGKVERAAVPRNLGTVEEKVTGYLTEDRSVIYDVLLSNSFEENNATRHIVAFGGHGLDDEGQVDTSEGQTTDVSIAVLESRNNRWTILIKAPSLTETGFNSNDPGVSLHPIGANRHVLQVDESWAGGGNFVDVTTLYEQAGASFKQLLKVWTGADTCGAVEEGQKCYTYEGKLDYDPKSNPAAYDLVLRLKGTYKNAAGKIIKIPVPALTLRSKDGKYSPLDQGAAAQSLWKAVTESPL